MLNFVFKYRARRAKETLSLAGWLALPHSRSLPFLTLSRALFLRGRRRRRMARSCSAAVHFVLQQFQRLPITGKLVWSVYRYRCMLYTDVHYRRKAR